MDKYDYRRAITDEIKDWIVNESDITADQLEDDNIANWISEQVWDEGHVTGNGAYYYDTEDKCSEYLSNNFDLLYEAVREFCIDDNVNSLIAHYEDNTLARYFDTTIRCYLLYECIEKALEELKDEMGRVPGDD